MKDLNEKELKKIEGGVLPAWLIFTAGAILGGALYDVQSWLQNCSRSK
jgi:lactobin A/cerein 7B family class IIb bacteriocin